MLLSILFLILGLVLGVVITKITTTFVLKKTDQAVEQKDLKKLKPSDISDRVGNTDISKIALYLKKDYGLEFANVFESSPKEVKTLLEIWIYSNDKRIEYQDKCFYVGRKSPGPHPHVWVSFPKKWKEIYNVITNVLGDNIKDKIKDILECVRRVEKYPILDDIPKKKRLWEKKVTVSCVCERDRSTDVKMVLEQFLREKLG